MPLSNPASSVGVDGWVNDSPNAWTRTADTTFTVAGDRTAVFSKGTRIKVTDSTTKYFVVTASSHSSGTTTVTITGGTDYVLAANPTARYFSYAASPQGYPTWFSYTPALTASSSNPTLGSGSSVAGRFSIIGTMVFVNGRITFGTSGTAAGSGTYRFGLPITIGGSPPYEAGGNGFIYDSSASDTWSTQPQAVAGNNYVTLAQTQTVTAAQVTHNTPIAWAASDQLTVTVITEL